MVLVLFIRPGWVPWRGEAGFTKMQKAEEHCLPPAPDTGAAGGSEPSKEMWPFQAINRHQAEASLGHRMPVGLRLGPGQESLCRHHLACWGSVSATSVT